MRLVADIADAVQHAHDRGILHRDLKPSNILLQPVGDSVEAAAQTSRITDFGLARIIEETETGEETRSGVALGSPPYISPEQAAGKRRDVGPAADVYSLGATLYEIVSGRPPFQGESYLEILGQVLANEPVPLRILRPGLPRDLETICLTCLEKDPARRYPSAAMLRDDLERYLQGKAIRARPASIWLRVAKWFRRRPLHAAALSLLGLIVSGLVGGIVYRDILLKNHARELEREVVRADANAQLARRHLQGFQLRQAKGALDARQFERAQDILAAIQADRDRSDSGQDPGDPGFPWYFLIRLARRELVVLSDRQNERVRAVAMSADGLTLATGDEDGSIRLRDPENGRVRATLVGHQLPIHLLAFAPDGRRLISRGTHDREPPRKDQVCVWDLVSLQLQARVDALADRFVEDLHFGADSSHFWEVSWNEPGRRRLGLWDVATDPAHPRLESHRPTSLMVVPISGDGSIVALEEPGRRFVAHVCTSGTVLGRIGPIQHDYDFAVLSPDGRLLAVGRGPARKFSFWDIATGREKYGFNDPRARLEWFGFSNDSRYLVFDRAHGEIEIRDLVTDRTRTVTSPVIEAHPPTSFAFSSDSRYLITSVAQSGSPQHARVWQLDPWREVATYPVRPGAGFTPHETASRRSSRSMKPSFAGFTHPPRLRTSPLGTPTRPGRVRFPPMARSLPQEATIRMSLRRSSSGT